MLGREGASRWFAARGDFPGLTTEKMISGSGATGRVPMLENAKIVGRDEPDGSTRRVCSKCRRARRRGTRARSALRRDFLGLPLVIIGR
jgi:hypothetical protein